MSKKLIYSIIPARSGSKGVPGKNIKLLKGYPLLAYSIKVSLKSNLIERTIVSTDSEEIAIIAKKYGAEVPFLRPWEISQDTSTDLEFVLHALEWFKNNEGNIPDYLVHLRPTTPLRKVQIVDAAVSRILTEPESTALRSVHEMSESSYKTFEMENKLLKTAFNGSLELDLTNSGRQLFPKTYSANGYVDVLKSSFILKNHKIHGNKVIAFETTVVYEIDTTDDFDFIEYQLMRNNSYIKNFFKE